MFLFFSLFDNASKAVLHNMRAKDSLGLINCAVDIREYRYLALSTVDQVSIAISHFVLPRPIDDVIDRPADPKIGDFLNAFFILVYVGHHHFAHRSMGFSFHRFKDIVGVTLWHDLGTADSFSFGANYKLTVPDNNSRIFENPGKGLPPPYAVWVCLGLFPRIGDRAGPLEQNLPWGSITLFPALFHTVSQDIYTTNFFLFDYSLYCHGSSLC